MEGDITVNLTLYRYAIRICICVMGNANKTNVLLQLPIHIEDYI